MFDQYIGSTGISMQTTEWESLPNLVRSNHLIFLQLFLFYAAEKTANGSYAIFLEDSVFISLPLFHVKHLTVSSHGTAAAYGFAG
jgi:hypothetical protein